MALSRCREGAQDMWFEERESGARVELKLLRLSLIVMMVISLLPIIPPPLVHAATIEFTKKTILTPATPGASLFVNPTTLDFICLI